MARRNPPTLSGSLAFFVLLLFVVALVTTLLVTLFVLNKTLERQDRQELENRLKVLRENYNLGGLQAVRFDIEVNSVLGRERPFFVRVADPFNRTLIQSIPRRWSHFPFAALSERNPQEMPDSYRLESPGSDYAIEVMTGITEEGVIFQVGASDRTRRAVLVSSSVSFLAVAVPALLLSTILIVLRVRRSVRPIERLIVSVQETIENRDYSRTLVNESRTRETAELTEVLNRLLHTVDDLVRDLRSSLDSLAHDIRTPLTRIMSVVELAMTEPEPSIRSREEALRTVLEEVAGLHGLATRFLEASGKADVEAVRQEVSLGLIARDVIPPYQYVGEDRGIRIVNRIGDDIRADAYPGRLRQALANLLDNAVKYGPEGGTVEVRATQTDELTRVEVIDFGRPIDNEGLWEYRARGEGRGQEPGHGIGLSLVKRIAEAHNGRAYYERLDVGANAFVMEIENLPGETEQCPERRTRGIDE